MKTITCLIFMVLLAANVYAEDISDYTATYDIVFDKVVVDLNFVFEDSQSDFEWLIPKDAVAIEVKGHSFEIEEQTDSKKLIIDNNQFKDLNISYITGSIIESTRDQIFILDLTDVKNIKKRIVLKLPEQATLKYSLDSPHTSLFPEASEISTDGKRIIVIWSSTDLENKDAILAFYNTNKDSNTSIILIVFFVILVLGGLLFFTQKKLRRQIKSKDSNFEITRNLYEEEKKIVEILLEAKDNELWQKQLELKSGLSKVKLSRKIRNLEKKGAIEKIPYGNTNKIRIKKD